MATAGRGRTDQSERVGVMGIPNELRCCGKIISTKFCPDCGSKAEQSAALQLLQYVRSRLKGERKLLETVEMRNRPDRERQLVRLAATVERWKAWEETLEKLIESRNGVG